MFFSLFRIVSRLFVQIVVCVYFVFVSLSERRTMKKKLWTFLVWTYLRVASTLFCDWTGSVKDLSRSFLVDLFFEIYFENYHQLSPFAKSLQIQLFCQRINLIFEEIDLNANIFDFIETWLINLGPIFYGNHINRVNHFRFFHEISFSFNFDDHKRFDWSVIFFSP